MSLLGHVSKIVSILLSKLSDSEDADYSFKFANILDDVIIDGIAHRVGMF